MNILAELKSRTLTAENHRRLFTSEVYHQFAESRIALICRQWNQVKSDLTIKYVNSEDFTAYTDGYEIVLNARNPHYVGKTLRDCFLLQQGAIFHELGHRLFTMFGGFKNWEAALLGGKFYPARPYFTGDEEESVKKYEEFIADEKNAKLLLQIAHTISNCVEDGRIENLLLTYLAKYANMYVGLNMVREHTFEVSPSYAEIREKVESGEMKPIVALTQLILYYGRFGEIKGYSEIYKKDELIQKFDKLQDDLDVCLDALDEQTYFAGFNRIVTLLIDDIIAYIDEQKQGQQGQQSSQGQSSSGGQQGASSQQSSDADEDEESEDGSASDQEASDDDEEAEENQNQSQSNDAGEDEDESTSNQQSEPAPISEEEAEQIEEQIKKDFGKLSATTAAPDESATQGAGAANLEELRGDTDHNSKAGKENQVEMPKPPYTRTNSVSETFGSGKKEYINDYVEENFNSGEITWMGKMVSEAIEKEELREQIERDLAEFDSNIDFPKIHRNVNAKFYRHAVTDRNIEDYEAIGKQAEKLAEIMARKSNVYADPDETFSVMRYSGKRFKASELYKRNFKYFEKDSCPQESPKLAVALVVDESGSMYGRKIKYAKQVALTTYLYCQKINADVLVIGHDEDCYDYVEIKCYADFGDNDPDDKYRIMNIESGGNNRDGYALRYAKEKLAAQPCERKLLMIVSDGAPAGRGYYGTYAAADLRHITKECEKEGICLLAAAIDDDKDDIKGIYGEEHFLDITDLSLLPVTLAKKIKMMYT